MNHRHTHHCCAALDNERVDEGFGYAGHDKPGTRWRAALAALVAAPVRLHRYRHLHAEVVEDALRAFDCERRCGEDS